MSVEYKQSSLYWNYSFSLSLCLSLSLCPPSSHTHTHTHNHTHTLSLTFSVSPPLRLSLSLSVTLSSLLPACSPKPILWVNSYGCKQVGNGEWKKTKIGDVKTPCCSDAGCCPVESAKGEVGKWCARKYKGENMYSVSPKKTIRCLLQVQRRNHDIWRLESSIYSCRPVLHTVNLRRQPLSQSQAEGCALACVRGLLRGLASGNINVNPSCSCLAQVLTLLLSVHGPWARVVSPPVFLFLVFLVWWKGDFQFWWRKFPSFPSVDSSYLHFAHQVAALAAELCFTSTLQLFACVCLPCRSPQRV